MLHRRTLSPEGEAPRLRHCAGLDEDVVFALALESELSGVEALPSAEGVFSLSAYSVCCFRLDEQAELAKQAPSRRVGARRVNLSARTKDVRRAPEELLL
jgi:hypothetical protein